MDGLTLTHKPIPHHTLPNLNRGQDTRANRTRPGPELRGFTGKVFISSPRTPARFLRPPRCVSTGPVVCVLPGWQMNVNVNVTPARRAGYTQV